ncbi:helix-turn-helix domain-containing protein [Corynebacterium pseudodiphtheriticum]|uniref:helix-turn-helix domain-containing protein n=1 Tax=Corynebacterium pseudodiphtheriticum TaxID=37637 RepID=UPI002543CE96|nr:helix-turn-helix domain-containing protein [Corynebacterium pseudodiphtheriticum]MDK4327896.1 helix-turn-helix domain-containing protein [Corynebacterium pseudodiphtheriticum]
MSTNINSPYMSVAEATEYLRVSADTLRRWAREGRLKRVRLTRRKLLYLRCEIEALATDNIYDLSH